MTLNQKRIDGWRGRIDIARKTLLNVAAEASAEGVRRGEESFDPISSIASSCEVAAGEAATAICWLNHIDLDDQRAAS